MIRVVLDTNVIISAILFGGNPSRILTLARKRVVENVTSDYILAEVQDVLTGKFSWHSTEAVRVIGLLKLFSTEVYPKESIDVISYAPDNRILECAVEGKVDFIISGDRHLKQLKSYRDIEVMNPAMFLEIIDRREI